MFDMNNAAHVDFVKRNREAWLQQATALFRPWFAEEGMTVPEVQVSVGFGRRGGTKVIGECHYPDAAKDKKHHIFIHPHLADRYKVLGTLAHELVHASLPKGTGHRGRFPGRVKALGLEGKPTSTVEGPAFKEKVDEIMASLPEYPHAGLSVRSAKKQETRQLKVTCEDDEYIIRMSRMQLDRRGGFGPDCPFCGVPMVQV